MNDVCANLGIPEEIKVKKSEKRNFSGEDFVSAKRYAFALSYAGKLHDCIDSLVCLQKISDYRLQCNSQRSLVREFIFGKSSCSIEEPTCDD